MRSVYRTDEYTEVSTKMKKLSVDVERCFDRVEAIDTALDYYKQILDSSVDGEVKTSVQDKIVQYNNERTSVIEELEKYQEDLEIYMEESKSLLLGGRMIQKSFAKRIRKSLELSKSQYDRENKLEKVLTEKIMEWTKKYPKHLICNMMVAGIEAEHFLLKEMYGALADAVIDDNFPDEYEYKTDALRKVDVDLVFKIIVWHIINKDLPEDFLDQYEDSLDSCQYYS